MKPYTKTEPNFSETIEITEVGDPGHADYLNAAPKQLLANTLVNKSEIEKLQEKMEAVEQDLDKPSSLGTQTRDSANKYMKLLYDPCNGESDPIEISNTITSNHYYEKSSISLTKTLELVSVYADFTVVRFDDRNNDGYYELTARLDDIIDGTIIARWTYPATRGASIKCSNNVSLVPVFSATVDATGKASYNFGVLGYTAIVKKDNL